MAKIDHELKIWPGYFNNIIHDGATTQIRKNDRDFKVGDIIRLREWNPETQKYTGKQVIRRVTSIIREFPGINLNGHIILSIE